MSHAGGKSKDSQVESLLDAVRRIGNDTFLGSFDAKDLLKMRRISKASLHDMYEACKHQKYDRAFRTFFEQSPRAIEALIQNEHALLLEVFAFAISLDNGDDKPAYFDIKGHEVESHSHSAHASGPFWRFIAKSSHPVVILVADAENLDIGLLRRKLVEYKSSNHIHHHHPIILKTESSAAYEKVIRKLKHEEDSTEHSAQHFSKTWPLPIYVVHGSYQAHEDNLSQVYHLDMTTPDAVLPHISEKSAPQRTIFSTTVCSSG